MHLLIVYIHVWCVIISLNAVSHREQTWWQAAELGHASQVVFLSMTMGETQEWHSPAHRGVGRQVKQQTFLWGWELSIQYQGCAVYQTPRVPSKHRRKSWPRRWHSGCPFCHPPQQLRSSCYRAGEWGGQAKTPPGKTKSKEGKWQKGEGRRTRIRCIILAQAATVA